MNSGQISTPILRSTLDNVNRPIQIHSSCPAENSNGNLDQVNLSSPPPPAAPMVKGRADFF